MAFRFYRTWMRRLSFRGLSIQQRLPILICILLLSVIITGALISYFKVRSDALKSGGQRLLSSGEQLSNMLGQSSQSMINSTRTLAMNESVISYLQKKDTGSYNAAWTLFNKLPDTTTIVIELLDRDWRTLIRSEKPGMGKNISFSSLVGNNSKPDTGQVGNFYNVDQQLYYPVIAGTIANKEIAGYLVRWRRVTSNTRTISQIVKLMGLGEASVYFGSANNGVWTDMIKLVQNPVPASFEEKENVLSYTNPSNKKVIAIRKPIKSTNWEMVIEESQASLMQPVRNFLNELIIAGTVLLLLGISLAWLMSRNITRPLNDLTAATSRIAGGNYSTSVAVHRRDEIGKLARSFNAMVSQLGKTNERLEQKVKEAEAANDQLRNLSAHLQNIREEERMHIAREMHDELGQLLTGFKMDVSWLHKKLGENEDPGVREKLGEMMGMINDAAQFVRKLASELRPSILDDLGLIAALDWHTLEFKRRASIEIEFHSNVNELKTSELIATGLFRMYQESLTNVARHAEAKKVVSVLEVKKGLATLSISDDGKGFVMNGAGQQKTLGLLGMKERATMIGGNLEIKTAPGKGTTITITVPLQQSITKEPVLS